jgi:urease accessory protein
MTMTSPTTNRIGPTLTSFGAALGIYAVPAVAHAHHAMGGKVPATFLDGFLSGLAHPVIGLDHLAMILLIGAYAGASRQGHGPVLAFTGAALIGCLVHVGGFDLPHVETSIAVSLIVLGIAACAALRSPRAVTACVFGLVGVLHGYAYGESITGAEATPLVAYLVGLAVVQSALASLSLRTAARLAGSAEKSPRFALPRALGLASALVGVAFMYV